MPVKDNRYHVWWNMVQRCENENSTRYCDYGQKGIKVCNRWLDVQNGFSNFCKDMGERPEGFTLDRIDSKKGYKPSNCRWADYVTQNRNKESVKIKEHMVYTIFELLDAGNRQSDVARMFKVSPATICTIKQKRAMYEARTHRSSQTPVQ